MSLVSSYRSKSQSKVPISGGIELTLRKLSVGDFLSLGDIPAALAQGDVRGTQKTDPKFYAAMVRTVLLNCIVGPKEFVVTEKSPADCGPDEINLNEISPEDTTTIMQAVMGVSGLTKEAATEAKPFPEEQAPSSPAP